MMPEIIQKVKTRGSTHWCPLVFDYFVLLNRKWIM